MNFLNSRRNSVCGGKEHKLTLEMDWPPPIPRSKLDHHRGDLRLSTDFDYPVIPLSRHRDTPIYTERNSPLLGHSFYTPWNNYSCPSTESISLPEIINDYEFSESEDDFDDIEKTTNGKESVTHRQFSTRISAIITETELRNSALSFKCAGESLFHDEAAWLSSPLNQWNAGQAVCLPHILSRCMPDETHRSWMSDGISVLQGEDEGEILACATALAPAKANVIEVNHTRGMSIVVPPRSSSLKISIPDAPEPDIFHRSWMTFGGDSPKSDTDFDDNPKENDQQQVNDFQSMKTRNSGIMDIPLRRPPLPTTAQNISTSPTNQKWPTERSTLFFHDEPMFQSILLSLEAHISGFPSNILLSDFHCTNEIRSYLHNLPRGTNATPQLSTAYSDESLFLKKRSTPRHRYPTKARDSLPTNRLRMDKTENEKLASLPAITLEPLRRIFPGTSTFMCSALYAHLLAYIFVSPSSALATTNSSPNPNLFRTSIPSKAASLLGMTDVGCYTSFSQQRHTRDKLRVHISTLVSEMSASSENGCSGLDGELGVILLQSLIEVVRSSEGL